MADTTGTDFPTDAPPAEGDFQESDTEWTTPNPADYLPDWVAPAYTKVAAAKEAAANRAWTSAQAKADQLNAHLAEMGITPEDPAHAAFLLYGEGPGRALLVRPGYGPDGEEHGVSAGWSDSGGSEHIALFSIRYDSAGPSVYARPLTSIDDVAHVLVHGATEPPAAPRDWEDDASSALRELNSISGDNLTFDRTIQVASATAITSALMDLTNQVRQPAAVAEPGPDPQAVKLTADVVLLGNRETDGRDGDLYVLVIDRGWPPFEGCPALPGGHVELDEEPIDAAYRELTEETGIRIGPCLKPVGVYATPGRDPRGRYATWAYTARLGRLPEPTAGDDAAAARWVRVDDLLADGNLAFDHERIIRAALSIVR